MFRRMEFADAPTPMSIPRRALPMGRVPVASVPMRLVEIRLPVVPLLPMVTPLPRLPEMTPKEMLLPVAPDVMTTPAPLAIGFWPVLSVPMKQYWKTLALVPLSCSQTPATPLPEIVSDRNWLELAPA